MDKVGATLAVAAVLRVSYEDPGKQHYGYDLLRETSFGNGNLYTGLARLTRGRLVRTDPEPEMISRSEGPPRITYKDAFGAVRTVAQELESIDQSVSPQLRSESSQTCRAVRTR